MEKCDEKCDVKGSVKDLKWIRPTGHSEVSENVQLLL